MTLLDGFFLRYYPSALAASVICVVIPQASFLIKDATGYSPENLKPIITLFNFFTTLLPYQGIVVPLEPYFGKKAFSEDPYTRQFHHSKALPVIHELIARGYNGETPSIFSSETSSNLSQPDSERSFGSPERNLSHSTHSDCSTPTTTLDSPSFGVLVMSDTSPMKSDTTAAAMTPVKKNGTHQNQRKRKKPGSRTRRKTGIKAQVLLTDISSDSSSGQEVII